MIKQLTGFLNLLTHHRGESSDAYDDVAGGYDLFVPMWDRLINRAAMVEYERLLAESIPPGGRVLDAGSGTGERTLAVLRNSEPGSIVALDGSEAMLNVARSKVDDARVEFMVGDVTILPFEDDSFDVVSCTWVLSILDDPRVAVTEFLRVLKPGGTVLYAFCSLPEGPVGAVAKWIAEHVAPESNPASHLLPPEAQPFHSCGHSSLQRFSAGLATVVSLGKCCSVSEDELPCALSMDARSEPHPAQN